MPMPTTAKWPKPKSEDEFEDIVVDFLRIRWQDPHATRNGRRGQRQHGVDIVGHPPWAKGRTAGAQCKNTDSLTLAGVNAEVEKAKGFNGELSEFLLVTSGDRDAFLQAEVREHYKAQPAPFHVEILFWPDIVADISGSADLVAKHWKGFGSGGQDSDCAIPPPSWIGRESVRDDETAEYQCDLALWILDDALDLDAGELATGVRTVVDGDVGGDLIRELLKRPAVRLGGQFKWSWSWRECGNVISKWELGVGDRGLLTFRWAYFTTGALRFLDARRLLNSVFYPVEVHRLAIARAVSTLAVSSPMKVGARLAVHASGPLLLNDNIQATVCSRLSAPESPADWVVEVKMEQGPTLRPLVVRLLNKALANFSAGSDGPTFLQQPGLPFPQINEETLSKLFDLK
jgi:hypothetical protein